MGCTKNRRMLEPHSNVGGCRTHLIRIDRHAELLAADVRVPASENDVIEGILQVDPEVDADAIGGAKRPAHGAV